MAAWTPSTIDAAALGREAAERRRGDQRSRGLVEPGDYPVVLEEYAVVDILDMLGYLGFSALAVQEDRSFVEPGKRIGADLVTIVDDGSDPPGCRWRSTTRASPKQRVALVEAGVCRDVVYDAQTAARDGRTLDRPRPACAEPVGPVPAEHGHVRRHDLARGADRRAGARPARDPVPLHEPGPPEARDHHGMTRDGTFLVEGGKIVGPVKNLRYTQSYLDALAGVGAVGSERKTAQGLPRRRRRAGRSGSTAGRSRAAPSTDGGGRPTCIIGP